MATAITCQIAAKHNGIAVPHTRVATPGPTLRYWGRVDGEGPPARSRLAQRSAPELCRSWEGDRVASRSCGTASASSDDPAGFHGKQTYVGLFDKVRAATLAALDAYAQSDLDKPAPEDFCDFCPTMGDMFTLIATHPMMHAGQFVVVQRQLGKPILM